MTNRAHPEPTPAQLRGDEPMPGSTWEAREELKKELRELRRVVHQELWSTPRKKRRTLLIMFAVWLVASIIGTALGY